VLESIGARLKALARRAGFSGVPTPVLVAGMFLLTVAVVLALVRWWPHPADAGTLVDVNHAKSAAASKAAPSSSAGDYGKAHVAGGTSSDQTATVFVDVVGAVRNPGVYSLTDGARVKAAVDAAGGLMPSAAPEAVNLAAKAQDGEQIVVPTREQVEKGEVPAAAASGGSGAGAGGGGSGASASAATAGPGAKVNLNSADAAALDALPGIGPSTAAKIVADREANGPFQTPDDLGRVPGIGPKKLDQLKPLICVR
jgi:competence protein ComEA